MNKKFLLILFTAALWAAECFAAGHTSRIECEKGERWWGIFAEGGPVQPFSEPFKVNTARYGRERSSVALFSSLGRYVWSASPAEIAFDGKAFTIKSDSENVEAQRGGRNLREAYLVCCHKNFPPDASAAPDTRLLGKPVYDTWLGYGMEHSAEALEAYAARLLREGCPPGVLAIGEGWQHSGGGMEFDPHFYPDPKGFVERMHKLGFQVMLTATPFAVASGRGYVPYKMVCDQAGCVKVAQTPAGWQACTDIANHREMAQQMSLLVEKYGVDGFDMDATGAETFFEGKALEEFHGVWASWPQNPSLLVRRPMQDAGPGCAVRKWYDPQESPVRVINDAVAAAMAGYNCFSPQWLRPAGDRKMTDMVRFLQLASLMPAWSVPLLPDDPQAAQQVKSALKARASMAPYIAELIAEAARSGEPLVRCLEYNFPRSGFADCTDQYMIGARYMIAAVTGEGDSRTVRLPRGIWTDQQGKRHKGPLVIQAPTTNGPLVYELIK